MPQFKITAPDGTAYNVTAPEGASEQDALNQVMQQHGSSQSQSVATAPLKMGADRWEEDLRSTLKDAGWGARNLAGAGTAVSNLWERGKQVIGQGDDQAIKNNRILAEEAPIGSIAGNVALLAPTAMIPGANTLTGAALTGAVTGALQPTLGDEATLGNVATGAFTAVPVKFGADKLAQGLRTMVNSKAAALAAKQAQNLPRDTTMNSAIAAGYSVPPGMREDSGIAARLAEGISGRDRTNALMTVKNQDVTDRLARQAMGMAPDAPLTSESMQQIRKQAYQQGYEPVAQAGQLTVDKTYQDALDNVAKQYTGAAGSFKSAIPDEVGKLVDSFRVSNFDAGDALQASQALRDQATAAFRSGDTGTAKAAKTIAKALEDQIERGLQAQGQNGADLLKGFRDARQLMAKAHTVEDAIQEGGGKVNAAKLGSRYQAGKPLSGELKTIGAFANNFGKVAGLPKPGANNPITALDAMFAGSGSLVNPAALGIPVGRAALRYGLASKTGQKMMGQPDYQVNSLVQALSSGANNQLLRNMLPGVVAGETVRRTAAGF